MMINDNLDICIKFDPIVGDQGKDDDINKKMLAGMTKLLNKKLESFFYIQKGTYKLAKPMSRDISE